MANIQKRYYRAINVAEFIVEGHTIAETKEEFGISKATVANDLNFLANYGFGEENRRNLELYKNAKMSLLKNRTHQ